MVVGRKLGNGLGKSHKIQSPASATSRGPGHAPARHLPGLDQAEPGLAWTGLALPSLDWPGQAGLVQAGMCHAIPSAAEHSQLWAWQGWANFVRPRHPSICTWFTV